MKDQSLGLAVSILAVLIVARGHSSSMPVAPPSPTPFPLPGSIPSPTPNGPNVSVTVSPNQIQTDQPVTFAVQVSEPIAAASVQFGDGSIVETFETAYTNSPKTVTFLRIYRSAGSFTVTVTVKTPDGAVGVASVVVTVNLS